MNPQQIKFSCQSCQTLLQVPAELAGVSGPCPHCGATISAPALPSARPPSSAYPAIPSHQSQSPQEQAQRDNQNFAQNQPSYQSEQAAQYQPENPQTRPQNPHYQPENRQAQPQLPPIWQQRPVAAQEEVFGAQPEPNSLESSRMRTTRHVHNERPARLNSRINHRRWRWLILMILAILTLLTAVTVYILHLMQLIPANLYPAGLTAPKKDPIEQRDLGADAASTTKDLPPPASEKQAPFGDRAEADPSPPPSTPSLEAELEPTKIDKTAPVKNSKLPIEEEDLNQEGAIPNDPLTQNKESEKQVQKIEQAEKILSKFLRAQSLAGREPYIQLFRRKPADLAATSLDAPFPKVITVRMMDSAEFKDDGVESFFFIVAFENIKEPNYPRLIIVEMMYWGDGGIPKINADAFIDIYDKVPSTLIDEKKASTSDVFGLVSATSFCFDDVPNAQSKATILFLSYLDQKSQFAKAYLSSDSDILKKIISNYSIGKAGPASLKLRINDKEDPKNPYLEVIGFNAPNWH